MKTIPFLRSVCLVALLSATTLATAWSQIRSGTIVGKVMDARGYAVPGVEIAIRETGTNYTYNLKSNEVGEFTQPYLPFGAYEIVARKEGRLQDAHPDWPDAEHRPDTPGRPLHGGRFG